jgi:hypothetical protein
LLAYVTDIAYIHTIKTPVMKQYGLLTAVLFCCLCASSQQLPVVPGGDSSHARIYQPFTRLSAAMRKNLPARQQEEDKRMPPDSMPVAKYGKQEERFLFNNGSGMDVYANATDMMRIAKPDATFSSNMPVMKERYRQQQAAPATPQPSRLWPRSKPWNKWNK